MFRLNTQRPLLLKPISAHLNPDYSQSFMPKVLPVTDQISTDSVNRRDVPMEKSRIRPEQAKQPELTKRRQMEQIDERTDREVFENQIDSMIERRFKEYMTKLKPVEEEARPKEKKARQEPSEEFKELKRIVDQRLTGIDEIANYIREQKQENLKDAFKKLTNIENSIIEQRNKKEQKERAKEKEPPKVERIEVKTDPVPVAKPPQETITIAPPAEELGKKRKRVSYREIDNEEFERVKRKFDGIQDNFKDMIFTDDENFYFNLKNKKKRITKKLIEQVTQEKKGGEESAKAPSEEPNKGQEQPNPAK